MKQEFFPATRGSCIMNESSSLNERIDGSANARIVQEFLGNSAVYPLFDAIRTISLYGPAFYFTELPHYLLMTAAVIQAWYIGRRNDLGWVRRALGNLLAPLLYSVSDMLLEGVGDFFSKPYHWLYWGFSLGMAALYALEGLWPARWQWVAFLKNIWRVLLFPLLYAASELGDELTPHSWHTLWDYWDDSSGHLFILLAALLLGLLLGLRELQTEHYLRLLKQVARHLHRVSRWSLSADLLERSVEDTRVLEQKRVERTLLFADIRGFTAWSEARPPEEVVALLNQFYQKSEDVLRAYGGMKPHYIGDEVMSWFDQPSQALRAARVLRDVLQIHLRPQGLGVGLGLHSGPVIEGLLGSAGTRSYDVIGDTVNTASRIMAAARPGEILISSHTARQLGGVEDVREQRRIEAKGKREPIKVLVL